MTKRITWLIPACTLMAGGCAPMQSASDPGMLSRGARYNLPCSSYRFKVGPENGKPKIVVSHEIQADDISFTINPKRNPMVDRVQVYQIDQKGLLTSVKTSDVGKLPEIMEETARAVVALTQPAAGTPLPFVKSEDKKSPEAGNTLSPEEYKYFMDELAKITFEVSIPAGTSPSKKVPDEGGPFVLDFSAPGNTTRQVHEAEIRTELRKATRRAGPRSHAGLDGIPADDDILLAAGILARSVTSGKMSYVLSVRWEAVNNRRNPSDFEEAKKKQTTMAAAHKSAEDRLAKKDDESNKLLKKIGDLESTISGIKADGTAMETILTAILKDYASAEKKLDEFNSRDLKFRKDAEYWTKYGAALQAAGNPGEKAAIREKVIDLNTRVQQLVNDAVSPLATEVQELETQKDGLEQTLKDNEAQRKEAKEDADKDLAAKKKASAQATKNIPLIIYEEQMPLIDTSRVQYVPMWRSLVGTTVNEITVQNGLITKHDINEPSEVLGTVQIPLKVVSAILETTKSLWEKKKSALDEEANVLTSQAKVIKAQADLEEARKKQSTPPAQSSTPPAQ